MKFIVCYLISILIPMLIFAQKQTFNWCFGDSAGIDFNQSMTTNFISGMNSRGSCASISDSSGNLLFYAFTRATVPGKTTKVFNSQHQLMQDGDTIVGEGWYHELVIIPKPDSDSLFYIFSIGVAGSGPYGLYYSVVNMKANGGLGAVIQKNVMVMPDQQADCISAVKHGNGRDWWVVGRRLAFSLGQWNNEYYCVLVTPNGISSPAFQTIGSINKSAFSKINFSPSGDTLLFTNAGQLIEYFQFDRCSGILNNTVTIRPPATNYSDWTWSNEFSSNGRYLYTSTSKDTTQLFQYDLQSPNPLASRVTLYQSAFPKYCGGDVKRAPDGKIYFSIAYENVVPAYPYPDSIYNSYNMNLSVINSPDNLGTACDFQPYSFYLGGKRTYYGLPNNPDYFLGAKVGSPCDTLTALSEASHQVVFSNIWPNPAKDFVSINYFLPNGKDGKLEVFNSNGKLLNAISLPRYSYMQTININSYAPGIYLIRLSGANKSTIKKWIKQ